MCAYRAGIKPALAFCALAALTGLAGCASTGANSYTADHAAVAPPVAVAEAVEIEDDGLPAQTPPSDRIREMPDDPSEPYSRNYGGPNPVPVRARAPEQWEKVPDQVPDIPVDLPEEFRRKLVTALAQDE
jgi:hypothetical protein